MNKINKTIYFLGAGFSKDAGGPIQNELIKTILSDEFINYFNDPKTKKAYDAFIGFLNDELLISENNYEYVFLEDVFTPIDRCIAEGRTLGKYSYKQLIYLREQLHYLLAKSIQYGVEIKGGNKKYIREFAKYINSIAKIRLDKFYEDNIAILTTNWDLLLDNELNRILRNETELISGGDLENGPLAVVDYCCYISSLDDDMNIKPGLFALGRKGYNIKYLKLHGSMNWLHCPYCQRLYVKFNEKTMFDKKYCKHCSNNFKYKNNDSILLQGNLLLPTFIKDFRNIQLKLIWQNAGIELSEAAKIVFLGYSLPYADFEIRQLLSRFVRKDAKIEVVLYPNCDTSEEEQRYKTFFGDRDVIVLKNTIPNYVSNLLKTFNINTIS